MVAEMTCYTYLGHIRNPRIYAVPPNYAVFTRFYFHPKNRVKWGEYCKCEWELLILSPTYVSQVLLSPD